MSTTIPTTETPVEPKARPHWIGGLLPFIGVILFAGATVAQFAGGAGEHWGPTLVANAVTYLIGWAGLGAGISHIFFARRVSKTIGFASNDYGVEVGFADLAFGIVALMAGGFGPEFSLSVILTSSIFRVGCGINHVRSIFRERNFAPNNTFILFIDFGVPVFLVVAYLLWAS